MNKKESAKWFKEQLWTVIDDRINHLNLLTGSKYKLVNYGTNKIAISQGLCQNSKFISRTPIELINHLNDVIGLILTTKEMVKGVN